MKSARQLLAAAITTIYVAGMVITIPVIHWQRIQQKGFFAWAWSGEVVGSGEAIIWPITLVTHLASKPKPTKDQTEDIERFARCLKLWREADRLLSSRSQPSMVAADAMTGLGMIESCRDEANLVNPASLAFLHEGMPAKFEDEFRPGIRMLHAAMVARHSNGIDEARKLIGRYGQWHNEIAKYLR